MSGHAVSSGELRIELDGASEQLRSLLLGLSAGESIKGGQTAQIIVVSTQTLRRFAFDPFYFGLLQRRGYRAHDSHSHLVLQGENIFQLSLESISPEMRAAQIGRASCRERV